MVRRIWIDCSCVADRPDLRTGIQRCVRELAAQLVTHPPRGIVAVRLVRFSSTHVEELTLDQIHIEDRGPRREGQLKSSWRTPTFWRRRLDQVFTFVGGLLPIHEWRGFWRSPSTEPGIRRFLVSLNRRFLQGSKSQSLPERQRDLAQSIARCDDSGSLAKTALNPRHFRSWAQSNQLSNDDILLMLDSSWSATIWDAVSAFKGFEVKVVTVIYDLIPVLHPDWVDDGLVPIFRSWLDRSLQECTGVVCISKTVQRDLRAYVELMRHLRESEIPSASFYLGSNPRRIGVVKVSDESFGLFERPTFLVVGTIEPRKNHQYILDAFEELWARGSEVNLLVIGRHGWKVDDLMENLHSHPRRNTFLYVYPSASDDFLTAAYQNSTALVFASKAEGFGLPMMEALSMQLPVLASDIPIHREIGGEALSYFSLRSPLSLVDVIEDVLRESCVMSAEDTAPGQITWRESAEQLIAAIERVTS